MRAENITAAIITRDEAHDLPICLDNVQRVTPNIVVVDDFSRDSTAQIAECWGAKVYRRMLGRNYAQQRNFALDQVGTDWVLVVDADEVLSAELVDEIHALPDDPEVEAFEMPRKNFYKRRELKGARFSDQRDRHIRLFRSHLRYEDERPVHEYIGWQPDLVKESLDSPILHYTYSGLREYIEKMRRYSTLEADIREDTGLKRAMGAALVDFVRGKGYQDGLFGAVSAIGDAWYEFNVRHTRRSATTPKTRIGP